MVKTTSGSYLLPQRSVETSRQPAAETPRRLEELINDLVRLERAHENIVPILPKASLAPTSSFSKYGLPDDIRMELKLPSSPDVSFQILLDFYKNHRHKPLVEMKNGRVLFVEYDVQMERIRLFAGNKSRYTTMVKGALESGGFFVIEGVYELQMETTFRQVLGLKKAQRRVQEKCKTGSELLSVREAEESLLPTLYFTVFYRKLTGIASSCVKSEHYQARS
jgi:hypothetical protein